MIPEQELALPTVPDGWPAPGVVEVDAPVDEFAGVVLDVEPLRG